MFINDGNDRQYPLNSVPGGTWSGLNYINWNTTIPTASTGTFPRQVVFGGFQTRLPPTWSVGIVGVSQWTITGSETAQVDPVNERWFLGNQSENVIFDVTVPIPDNVPFDYGRSSTLLFRGQIKIDQAIPGDPANMQDVNGSTPSNANFDDQQTMMWLERPTYDIVAKTVSFKMQHGKNSLGGRVYGLLYLRE